MVEESAVVARGRSSNSKFVAIVGSMVSVTSEAFIANAHIPEFFRIFDWDTIPVIIYCVEIIIKIL